MKETSHTALFVCPDCQCEVYPIRVDTEFLGFYCDSCKLVFPIRQNTFIFLPKYARNHDLEMPLVKNMSRYFNHYSYPDINQYVNNTLILLEQLKDKPVWEWEDENYWSRHYAKARRNEITVNWNMRMWQRNFLVECLKKEIMNLNNKIILDLGCGEGQNFRFLLSQFCDKNTLYIAADISLEGLELNRIKNIFPNSLYVLCCAGALPIKKNSIDILCCFGILHHTKEKSKTLLRDALSLKKDGYILIHEALARPAVLKHILKNEEESLHEERIDEYELLENIKKSGELKVVISKEMNTIVMSGFIRIFPKIVLNSKLFYSFVAWIDWFFMKAFRRVCFYFKPAEILMMLRKVQNST